MIALARCIDSKGGWTDLYQKMNWNRRICQKSGFITPPHWPVCKKVGVPCKKLCSGADIPFLGLGMRHTGWAHFIKKVIVWTFVAYIWALAHETGNRPICVILTCFVRVHMAYSRLEMIWWNSKNIDKCAVVTFRWKNKSCLECPRLEHIEWIFPACSQPFSMVC